MLTFDIQTGETAFHDPCLCSFGILEAIAALGIGEAFAGAGAGIAGGLGLEGATLGGISAGTAITTGLEGAAIGGLGGGAISAITGKPILEGAGIGALTGGLTGGLGPSIGAGLGIGTFGGDVLAGAGAGALGSGITGGDPLTGTALGAGSGALSGALSDGAFGGSGGGPAASGAISGSGPGAGAIAAPAGLGAGPFEAPAGIGLDISSAPGASFSFDGQAPTAAPGNVSGGQLPATGSSYGDIPVNVPSGDFKSPLAGGGSSSLFGPSNPSYGSSVATSGSGSGGLFGGGGGDASGNSIKNLFNDPSLDHLTTALGNNANWLIPGAGLGYLAIKGSQPYPGQQQMTKAADSLAAQGASLQQYLQTGTLPPGVQNSVTTASQSAKAAIRSRYASMGGNTSAMEQDLANVDRMASSEGSKIAIQLLQAGVNETQLSEQIYSQLLNLAVNQDANLGKAIGQFSMAAAGVPSVLRVTNG